MNRLLSETRRGEELEGCLFRTSASSMVLVTSCFNRFTSNARRGGNREEDYEFTFKKKRGERGGGLKGSLFDAGRILLLT